MHEAQRHAIASKAGLRSSLHAPRVTPSEAARAGRTALGQSAWLWRSTAALAALVFVLLCVLAARQETPTIDEFAHLPAGSAYWTQGAFSLYGKNPPLLKLWIALPVVVDSRVTVPPFSGNPFGWGPWTYGRAFMEANRESYFALFFRARLMVIVLGLATAALLFVWARELFGERAAAVAASLLLLSPPILAHSRLATIDAGSMLTILATCWLVRRACRSGRAGAFALAGAALGVALGVKFTALLILPAIGVLALLGPRNMARARGVCILLLVAWLTVNAAFGFGGTFQRLDGYRFHSRFCIGLQQRLPGALPVPLPRDYVAGFDAQKRDTEAGEEFGSYLLGEWSRRGWWYYNAVALLVKTPIHDLLLALAGTALWRRSRIGATETWPILLPAASLVLLLSAFSRLDVGIRYLLPVFPFLHLASGPVFAERAGPGRARWRDALALAAVVAALSTSIASHPDHLAYFNAIAGGSERGHEWLVDSNLDWGQDLYRVPAEAARLKPGAPIGLLYFGHVDPTLYGLRYNLVPPWPVRDVLAVSVNFVVGMQYLTPAPDGRWLPVSADHLAWLRSHEPVARLGSMWVYDTRGPAGGLER